MLAASLLPPEFAPLTEAEPTCHRRANLADRRSLRRRRWRPDVPLGPLSARVTWGHALPCRPAPRASAAATATQSSSDGCPCSGGCPPQCPCGRSRPSFLPAGGRLPGGGSSHATTPRHPGGSIRVPGLGGCASAGKPRPPVRSGRGPQTASVAPPNRLPTALGLAEKMGGTNW